MRTDPRGEDGFGLIEVIVCVALLVAGSVLALALLPAVAHASQAQLMREAATGIARNAVERTRAAAAYAPPAAMNDAAVRAATSATHTWVLRPAAHFISAVRVRRSLCAGPGPTTDVAVDVALAYDAASDALSVAVTYPPDPCNAARRTTLTLRAIVAPPADAPQTRVGAAIADPAQQ
jgi:Tfp pilus assembly protein PilV